jgi:hypothetical protein
MNALHRLSPAPAIVRWSLGILWAFACTSHAAGDALTVRPATLSVSSTVSGCSFTVDVTWSGYLGGNAALEVSLLQLFAPTNDGVILEPSVLVRPVKGKGGSVSVTMPALKVSGMTNSFRAAAQLLDNKGAPIGSSSQWSDVIIAYCTGMD